MASEINYFLKPLLLTLAFEVPLAFILGIRRKNLLLILLVNVITNPLLSLSLYYLVYNLGIDKAYKFLPVLEIMVVITEYLYFRNYLSYRHPFLLSLILNLISFLGGLYVV